MKLRFKHANNATVNQVPEQTRLPAPLSLARDTEEKAPARVPEHETLAWKVKVEREARKRLGSI